MAHDPKELLAIADRVLGAAKTAAADAEVLVKVTGGRDANTRFAHNEITSNGDVDETVIEVEVSFGQRHASTTTNQVDDASVKAVLDRAVAMARLAPVDPEAMPLLDPQTYPAVKGAFDARTEQLDEADRAAAAGVAIAAAKARQLSGAGFYQHSGWTVVLRSSKGLAAQHQQTQASLEVTARTTEGGGSGWGLGASPRAADIGAAEVARVATDKAVRSAHPRPLDPGRYSVVLEPVAVRELLEFLVQALDARRADEGRSFFRKQGGGNRVGEKVLADMVTLRSDPTDAETPDTPFDDDGLPFSPTAWIDKGTVAALRYSRYWAHKQGKPPTGNPGIYQLTGGAAASTDELVRGMKRGLVVTRFWYTRWVDPQAILITGLTRDGVFLVEDGQIVAPVNNFRFNESPITMLKNVDAMTKETFRVPSWRVPALRTHEFNMASKSDAV